MFDQERLEIEIEELKDSITQLKFNHEQATKSYLRNLKQFEFLLIEKEYFLREYN